ncbi:MAG: hypothetical protein UX39_C0003G0015 [Candidatus Magasanikbacteria bacterium GW2011_GWA2_46_17]|uniref:Uncharacterized protein n=2 Tax=Parcubacteria group TaxID=1794811 RepID=A0A0G1P380_9BACT|nr:MAG: hypothetical protein UX39_C0003G0015 [Candidatus Magasanikbacteria bacterium GW2011_GWA2_46_17]
MAEATMRSNKRMKMERSPVAQLEARIKHLETFLEGYTREVIKFTEFVEEWGRGVDAAIDRPTGGLATFKIPKFNFLDTKPDGSTDRPIEQG